MDKSVKAVFQLRRTTRELTHKFLKDGNLVGITAGINTTASSEDPCSIFDELDVGLDSHSLVLFQFVVYGILLPAVGLLGLAGNIISITIMFRSRRKSSINCCLIGLTSFDLIVTTTSILMLAMPEISDYTGAMTWYSKGLFQKAMPSIYTLGLIAQTGLIYLTVAVTIERYVAVCLPFKRRTFCTYGRARMTVVLVALFSIAYNLPRIWEVSYKECYIDEENVVIVVPSALRSDPYYKKVYIMWMYLIVIYLIPFFSLLIFNAFIYSKVRSANLEIQRLSNLQRNEIGLATMLLVVVSVFFICNVLALVINILEISEIIFDELIITSNLLVTINSSVNFIIYCTFGQKFRQDFLKMFCSRFVPSPLPPGGAVHPGGESPLNGRLRESIRLTPWNDHLPNHLLNPYEEHDTSFTHFTFVSEAGFWKRDGSCLSFEHLQAANFQ